MMTLAAYLEAEAETQTAFAARAGLSDSTLSRVLAGKTPPSADVIERIHTATKGRVTANDLFATWRDARAVNSKRRRAA